MKCKKCGHDNAPSEWVCSRCEYILDPSFLGSDILNERTRDGLDDEPLAPLPPEEDFGGDALILGRLGESDESENAPQPFITDRSNDFMPAMNSKAPASVYITAELRNLLMPFRVLQHTADAAARVDDVLTPFHRNLFDLIDGTRTLEEVQNEVGLSDHDLCVAVAMLCDKALVEAKHEPKKPHPKTTVDLDDSTRELEDLPPIATPADLDAVLATSPPAQAQSTAQSAAQPAAQPAAQRMPERPAPSQRRSPPPASITPGMPSPFEPPERDEPSGAPANVSMGAAAVGAAAVGAVVAGAAPPVVYDDLEMRPLPVPTPALAPVPGVPPTMPRATPARPVARPAARPAASPHASPAMHGGTTAPAGEMVRPAARPGLNVRPAMPPVPKTSAVPDGKLKPALPSSSPQPASGKPGSGKVAKADADDRAARAASYFDLCMKDLHDGRQGRAWGYARMALEADPTNEKYQMLVHDWHRSQAGAQGEKASTPQELMASAQAAENSGDYAAAVEYIKRVVGMAPSSAAAHNRLAVLLATRMHEYRAAYNAAIKAVELEPGNMAYQSNMMKILARVDDDDKSSATSKAKAGGGGGLLGRLLKR